MKPKVLLIFFVTAIVAGAFFWFWRRQSFSKQQTIAINTRSSESVDDRHVHSVGNQGSRSNDGAALIDKGSSNIVKIEKVSQHEFPFTLDGSSLQIRVHDLVPPVRLIVGRDRLNSSVCDWAATYSHSLPKMSANYAEWKEFVTDDMTKLIAPTQAQFDVLRAQNYAEREAEILYAVEAISGSVRMLYVVERSVFVPGGNPANAVKNFKWTDGRWLAHVKDDLKLVGRIPVSTRDQLQTILKRGHE